MSEAIFFGFLSIFLHLDVLDIFEIALLYLPASLLLSLRSDRHPLLQYPLTFLRFQLPYKFHLLFLLLHYLIVIRLVLEHLLQFCPLRPVLELSRVRLGHIELAIGQAFLELETGLGDGTVLLRGLHHVLALDVGHFEFSATCAHSRH